MPVSIPLNTRRADVVKCLLWTLYLKKSPIFVYYSRLNFLFQKVIKMYMYMSKIKQKHWKISLLLLHYLHVSSKLTISEKNAQKSAKITHCSKCNKSKTTGVTLYFDINPKGRLSDPLCCVLCLEVQNISIKSTLVEREVMFILEYKTLTGKPLKTNVHFKLPNIC